IVNITSNNRSINWKNCNVTVLMRELTVCRSDAELMLKSMWCGVPWLQIDSRSVFGSIRKIIWQPGGRFLSQNSALFYVRLRAFYRKKETRPVHGRVV